MTPHPDDISALDHGKSRTLEKSAVLHFRVWILAASSRRTYVIVIVRHVQVRIPHWRRVVHARVPIAREAEVKALRNWEAHTRAVVY